MGYIGMMEKNMDNFYIIIGSILGISPKYIVTRTLLRAR